MGRSSLARVPAWAWLAAIVLGSCLLRVWLVRGMVAPFIFIDELIYSELAKSVAEGGGYAIRGAPTSGYSLTYPALVAPAWGIFDDGVTAYNAAKSINAVVMSLAAIPTYFLAVRVARPSLALLAALIAVVVPSMAYTGTITTESLFYPVALGFALALVRYLERASLGRLAIMLGALVVAFFTRSQALAFVPVLLTAPLALAAIRGSRSELRRFALLYGVVFGGGVLVVAVQAIRGRSPFDLLGAYATVGESQYDLGQVLRFWLWHVEVLVLYVAVVPVVALGVLIARGRSLPARVAEHVAVAITFLVWSTLAVGMFASRFAPDRVQDRYLFFLTPLLVIALVAWVDLGAPRPRVSAATIAAIALLLALVFPYGRFIGEPAKSDTLALIPLWAFQEHLVASSFWGTVALVGGALVATLLFVPARWAVVVPLAVLVLFAVLSRPVWTSDKGFLVQGKGALRQGIADTSRTWIDDAVRGRGEVVALWTGNADRFTINMNEFFNRSVGGVFYTDTPTPGGLSEVPVSQDGMLIPMSPSGIFSLPNDGVIHAPFALLDPTVDANGRVIARSRTLGMRLWRLSGPLADKTEITGLFPYPDTWSGAEVTWTRVRCTPGALTVRLHSDANLFAGTQSVTAKTASRVSFVSFPVTAERALLRIRVTPDAEGVCEVRFTVSPTANPAENTPGSTDDRILGAHFDAFTYVSDT